MIILQLDSKQLSNIVQNAVHEALISATNSLAVIGIICIFMLLEKSIF